MFAVIAIGAVIIAAGAVSFFRVNRRLRERGLFGVRLGLLTRTSTLLTAASALCALLGLVLSHSEGMSVVLVILVVTAPTAMAMAALDRRSAEPPIGLVGTETADLRHRARLIRGVLLLANGVLFLLPFAYFVWMLSHAKLR